MRLLGLVSPPVFTFSAVVLLGNVIDAAVSPLAALPLAVKSPYLHQWIIRPTTINLAKNSGQFWTTTREISWTGLIRVDGETHQWMGTENWPGSSAVTLVPIIDRFLTPTRSIFAFQAGPIRFNATFLSPVEPDDLALQSLPFTYMYINNIISTDNQPHEVQVYSDISAQWVSGSDFKPVVWSTRQAQSIVYHACNRNPIPSILETTNMAEDATVYYAMSQQPNTTWVTGDHGQVRLGFLENGTLPNSQDTQFRNINDRWPVFGFARDLGKISSLDSPVVWALGLVRDPVVMSSTSNDFSLRTSYFWTRWSSIDDVIQNFISRFSEAETSARNLDAKIQQDASRVSEEYTDLVSLALRQTLAGVDITLPGTKDSPSSNISDIYIYLKNIGYNTDTSPIETVYAAFPGLLYLNATMARYLLTPIMEYQTRLYPTLPFVVPNLGSTYPLISEVVQNNSTAQAIENTGNMLVMSLAYSLKTGDNSLISAYYDIFELWANNLRNLMAQIFKDSNFGPTSGPEKVSPNAILQGIIGLYCFAAMAPVLGEGIDPVLLQDIANILSQWKSLAVKPDHILGTFGVDSVGIVYNIFPLKLLGIKNLLPQEVLDMQEAFEDRSISENQLGPTLDNSNASIATHLTMFTAATFGNKGPRDAFIRSVHRLAFDSTNPRPFASIYSTTSGRDPQGLASPAQGAMFALLAAGLPNVMEPEITLPAGRLTDVPSSSSDGTSKAGIIAGSVTAAVIALVVVFAFLYRSRIRRRHRQKMLQTPILTHLSRDDDARDQSLVSAQSGLGGNPTRRPAPPNEYQSARTKRLANTPLSADSGSDMQDSLTETPLVDNSADSTLRNEIRLLRREMANIRIGASVISLEHPPSYSV